MLKHSLLVLAVSTVLLAGCKKKDEAAPAPAPAVDAPTTAATTPAAAPVPAAEFDINSVPVSDKPLGAFPFITIPAGYSTSGRADKTKDFGRFPFWVNGKAHWVEGKSHEFSFSSEDKKEYSQFEIQKNLEDLVAQLGGVKVSEGKIPKDIVESWGDEITVGYIDGLGDVYNNPVRTYLVRRNDGNIWIHFTQSTAQGNLLLMQEKAFNATAKLLPASELKKQIDAAGKVALQVNFATDKTDILPESQPQIDQVVQLLKDDPALKLAVNGHTDNSGDKAHNQTLSEGRAKSVVSALSAKGIAAARLSAKGFGDSQPVADNATTDGKSKNRRVELVKN